MFQSTFKLFITRKYKLEFATSEQISLGAEQVRVRNDIIGSSSGAARPKIL